MVLRRVALPVGRADVADEDNGPAAAGLASVWAVWSTDGPSAKELGFRARSPFWRIGTVQARILGGVDPSLGLATRSLLRGTFNHGAKTHRLKSGQPPTELGGLFHHIDQSGTTLDVLGCSGRIWQNRGQLRPALAKLRSSWRKVRPNLAKIWKISRQNQTNLAKIWQRSRQLRPNLAATVSDAFAPKCGRV